MNRRLASCAIAALVVLLSGCAGLPTSVEAPRISLERVALDQATVLEQRYTLTLRVENPNAIGVPIRGLSYAVRLAGTDFASGTTPQGFTVPAQDVTLIDVGVTTNLLQSARQLMTFLAGKPDAVDYALSGEVAIDLPFIEPIPFARSGQVAFADLVNP